MFKKIKAWLAARDARIAAEMHGAGYDWAAGCLLRGEGESYVESKIAAELAFGWRCEFDDGAEAALRDWGAIAAKHHQDLIDWRVRYERETAALREELTRLQVFLADQAALTVRPMVVGVDPAKPGADRTAFTKTWADKDGVYTCHDDAGVSFKPHNPIDWTQQTR